MIIKYLKKGGFNAKYYATAALAVSSLLSSCSNTENQAAEHESDAPAVVEAISLEKGKLLSSIQLPGELVPFQQVDLYAKENSFVKKIYADVGSEVNQNDLLASLDAPEINSRLAESSSRLQSQEAIYNLSKAYYDRLIETSKTPGTISSTDLDQALSRKNSDYAQLQAAQSAYRAIADTRNYLEIRAPFSGVITARNVNAGAYVGPSGKGSEAPLFVLQEQKKLRLVISVPEVYTGLLKQNDEISFTVKSLQGEDFKAKVKRMAGSLDDKLRSERLEMDVDNPKKRLLPGMYAEVNLPLPAKDSTFVIPKTAVVANTEKIFVIRVTNNKAEWVNVSKGREADGKIEIYGKLNAGDKIVKIANDEIRDDSELKNIKISK